MVEQHEQDREDALAGSGHALDDGTAAAADGTGAADPLLELRAALDEVDDLPLADRAQVFERTHAVVVAELRALEPG